MSAPAFYTRNILAGTTQVTNATVTNAIDTWDADGRPFERLLLYVDHPEAAATNTSAQWTALRLLQGRTRCLR